MPAIRVPCSFDGCNRHFSNQRGLNAHIGRKHKVQFNPHTHHIHNANYDLESQPLYESHPQYEHQDEYIQEEYIQEEYIQEDFTYDQEPTVNIPEADIPESQRYHPFTHQQYWLLNWMHNALVSQSQQNRFYKDVRLHGFGFDNTHLRSYTEAESLLHYHLRPIPFDTAEIVLGDSAYIMHFRDIPTMIEALLKREDLKDDISYKFEEVRTDAGGNFTARIDTSQTNDWIDRLYSEITNCNNFKRIERRIPIGNTLLYIIFAIDDTCLSSHSGQAKARPLYLTLGNFSNKSRRMLKRHAWMLVGLLPLPHETHQMTPNEKTQFNHKTMEIALSTLVQAESTGMDILCSDGIRRTCTPVPAQLIVDLMEAYTLAGIPSQYCPKCLVKRKAMHDLHSSIQLRHSEEFKYVLEDALLTSNTAAIKYYCEKYMVSPIYNAFWSFKFVNVHSMFYCDTLHQLIEGLFLHLLEATERYLISRRLYTELNRVVSDRIRIVPSFSDLHINRTSIFRMGKYTGKVCANIMKIIVHLLRSGRTRGTSCLDHLIITWDLYVDILYYAKLPSHDEQTIAMLETTILKFEKSLKLRHGKGKTLWESQTSQWNFPKYHCLKHYGMDIRDIGCLYNGDTQPAEAMHSAIKDIWRFSCNHKDDTDKQIMKVHSSQEAMKIFTDARTLKYHPPKVRLHGAKLTSEAKGKTPLVSFAEAQNSPYLIQHLLTYLNTQVNGTIDLHDIWVKRFGAVTCVVDQLGDINNDDKLTLRALQNNNWGHAGRFGDRIRNDFIALYRADWDDDHIHGLRRFDIGRIIYLLRIYLPARENISFDVVYLENWTRADCSDRFRVQKYRNSANLTEGRGYSFESIDCIFRPVQMMPSFSTIADPDTRYLNSKTDIHAWMNLHT